MIPKKLVPGLTGGDTGFRKRLVPRRRGSCSTKNGERDDDPKISHPALEFSRSVFGDDAAGSEDAPIQAGTKDLLGRLHVGPEATAVPRRNRGAEEGMGAEVSKEIFKLQSHVLPVGEPPFDTTAGGPARERSRIRSSEPRIVGEELVNIELGKGGAAGRINE